MDGCRMASGWKLCGRRCRCCGRIRRSSPVWNDNFSSAVGTPAAFCVLKGVSRRSGLCPERDRGGGFTGLSGEVGGCRLLHHGHHPAEMFFSEFIWSHSALIGETRPYLMLFLRLIFRNGEFWVKDLETPKRKHHCIICIDMEHLTQPHQKNLSFWYNFWDSWAILGQQSKKSFCCKLMGFRTIKMVE